MNTQETSKAHFPSASITHSNEPRAATLPFAPALALLFLFALSSGAAGQAVLTDDANTSAAPRSSDTKYGTNPNLFVSAAGGVYVKFKLSSVLPAGTSGSAVDKATLKLYLGNVMTAGKLDIYAVSGAWDEATITANNAPPLGALLSTTEQIGTDKRGKYLVVDVTPLVKQWLGDDGLGTNGIANRGLAIVAHTPDGTTPESASITFDSKENGQTSHEPQLDIQLKRGSGTVTGITAESPISVTNATTAPDISLGTVPADKGGTGLTSPGAAGNLLRSDGTSWTSAALTGPDLPAGSGSYIQNGAVPQAGANFNISGSGAADIFNAATQYNLGGSRVLSAAGSGNLFAGVGSGAGGSYNSFFGASSGGHNATGLGNSYFGYEVGENSTAGSYNSFFGYSAGFHTTTGGDNSYFGREAGFSNTTGGGNSYFGSKAGFSNTDGFSNTFLGRSAGQSNTTGPFNTFVGNIAGLNNTTGCCNNFFGDTVGLANTTGAFNSFFGGSAGLHNTTGEANAFFGDRSGQNNTTGSFNTFYGIFSGQTNTTGNQNTLLGSLADVGAGNLNFATAVGSGAIVNTSNTVVLGRNLDTVKVPGSLTVSGNILVGSPGQGIILRSPDGATCRLFAIDNGGNATLTAVSCP